MISNLSHVAIGVRDMDSALAFYRDALGLAVRFDDTEDFGQTGTMPPHSRRGVYLYWEDAPEAGFIVLDHSDRGNRQPDPKNMHDFGFHHFGFWVRDVDGIFARLEAGGYEVVVAPQYTDTLHYGERAGGRIRVAVVRDPDGNIIQLDQRID